MRQRLKEYCSKHENCYSEAKPFPHLIIDNFLEISYAKKLAHCLNLNNVINNKNWTHHSNENADRYRLEDEYYMDKDLQDFARFTNSRDFVLFLESITSYESLIGDPYFVGGGAMISTTGGFLNLHVDFNWSHKLQLWRKINFIIYLTEDWKEEWGGELILSSKDGTIEKSIEPLFNRAVIFKVDGDSYHGQPNPVIAPNGIARSLFSSFYYSSEKFNTTSDDPHFTKYKINNSPIAQSLKIDH